MVNTYGNNLLRDNVLRPIIDLLYAIILYIVLSFGLPHYIDKLNTNANLIISFYFVHKLL